VKPTWHPHRQKVFRLSRLLLFFLPASTSAATPYFDARFRAFDTPSPVGFQVADLNHDGLPDIIGICEGGVGFMAGRSDGDFSPFVLWPTGTRPHDIAVGDLNGDGNLDCVTAEEENQVSILLGKADGTFQPRQVFAAIDPSSVGIGDFNNDHRPDLVIANYHPKTLSVMLQDQNGGFAAPIGSPSGNFPGSLVVRDMDLDNNQDVVYADNFGYGVVYGNGNGSFGAVDFADPPYGARSIAVEDLNGDNRPDLVVSNVPGVFIRFGAPNRTFENPVSYAIGDVGNAITIADATGDGTLDLLVSTNNKGRISLLSGLGNGTFGGYVLLPAGQSPGSVGVADFTHDGIVDLVSSDGSGSDIVLMEGNGDNTFGHQESYSTSNFATAMILEDLNHDSRPDVVFASGSSPPARVWICLINPRGVPRLPSPYDCDAPAVALATSDFNNDGHVDIAAARYYSTICFWLNNGSGGLGNRVELPFRADLLVSGDFNEDGNADLLGLYRSYSDLPLKLFLGNGNGTFDGPLEQPAPNYINACMQGDVNGDSHLDLIYTRAGSHGTVMVWVGDGTGQFAQTSTLFAGNEPDQTILADIDLDGCLDLVTSNKDGRSLSIFRGHCDATFDTSIPIDVGTFPRGMICANLDGDGLPDLAVANYGGNTVSLLRGNGAFGFARTDLGTGSGPFALGAGDLRQSGNIDLLTLDLYDQTFSVLRNRGGLPSTVGIGEPPKVELTPRLVNAPNPFAWSTTLSFVLPEPGRLRLTIHDIQGRSVRELTDGSWTAGEHRIVWDGKDQRGVSVVPGLYLAKLKAPRTQLSQKLFRIAR